MDIVQINFILGECHRKDIKRISSLILSISLLFSVISCSIRTTLISAFLETQSKNTDRSRSPRRTRETNRTPAYRYTSRAGHELEYGNGIDVRPNKDQSNSKFKFALFKSEKSPLVRFFPSEVSECETKITDI